MIGRSPDKNQKHLFLPNLTEFINPEHELVLLAARIDWRSLEEAFAPLYSRTGAPAKPVRLMVGLLILKQVYGLGDETVVREWVSNPYFQHFCGETVFRWEFPCDPSDLVHFRGRIGEPGVERVLAASIAVHGPEVLEEDVSVDTTVQPKNIAFPTDSKIGAKVIRRCAAIARRAGVRLRQSYRFVLHRLLRLATSGSRKLAEERERARRRILTIAGRVVRDLGRKLAAAGNADHTEELELCARALVRGPGVKDKVYALHAPEAACIGKGKERAKYEFGSKASFAVTQRSNVILAAVSFRGSPNDNQTLEETFLQQERVTGVRPKVAYVDRGYKQQVVGTTEVRRPDDGRRRTKAEQRRLRKAFRRRAAIEPVIGHLKSDHGLGRNYLKGETGDRINAMLAAAGFNFRSWMRKALAGLVLVLKLILALCRPARPLRQTA